MDDLQQRIKDRLAEFWDERAIDIGGSPADIGELGVPMDSLTSIEVLLEIDTLVGREIPAEMVIKKGGYQSKEEFIEEVTSKVLVFYRENLCDK